MRLKNLFYLLLVCISFEMKSQTILYPGDLAIVGIQTDNPDNFSFIFLTTIQKHTVVFFTDCGVKADGSFRNGEGGLKYVASRDLAPGTLVDFVRDSADFSRANDEVLGSRGFNLSSSGDQIIAFQDSSIHPHYLYAIQTNSSKWQAECTSTNISCLPPGLVEGYSALSVGKDTGSNNYWHNASLSSLPSGKTKLEIIRELGMRKNWKFANTIFPMPTSNINLLPDSNRYLIVKQGNNTIYKITDSICLQIAETNISRLLIRIVNLNFGDTLQIVSQWPSLRDKFKFRLPAFTECDSFKLVFEDSDFPGFIYTSETNYIKDTIPLRLVEYNRNSINPGDSIALIFNKPILPIKENLVLRNIANHNDSINLYYIAGEIIMKGCELIIYPSKALPGEQYRIEITEGWMSDMKGNQYSRIKNDSFPVVSILSQPVIDSIAPVLISVSPTLEEPISPDQSITFMFNEPLFSNYGDITDPDVLGGIISLEDLSGDNYYDFVIEYDSLYKSFTLKPIGLESGNSYYISMYGFSDSTGNECDEFIFTFETATKVSTAKLIPIPSTLSIYPNPGQDYITISGKNLKNSSIEVLDINGKRVFVEIAEQSECKIILNIQSIPNGTYLIRIRQNKAVSQLRLIKV